MSSLLEASVSGDWAVVKQLVKTDTVINLQDEEGRTPLIYAVIDKNTEIVELLLQKGDVNVQDNIGYTALHYASQNNLLEIAELLLKSNAEVNIQDIHGNTPLFKAVFHSNEDGEMIQLLAQLRSTMRLLRRNMAALL